MRRKIFGKSFFLSTFLWAALLLAGMPAYAACLTPAGDEGELAYKSDDKLLVYCSGGVWRAANQPGSGSGGCTMPDASTRSEGVIAYNADHRVMQVCAGNVWRPLGEAVQCEDVGDECTGGFSSGAFYIGEVDGRRIYATAEEHESNETWNNGTSNWGVTTADSDTDGLENTNTLLSRTGDGGYPYGAAEYCAGLANVHGKSDWYLPAIDELDLFWNGGSVIADINTSGQYISSTEVDSNDIMVQEYGSHDQHSANKDALGLVRCVRRAECLDPVGTPGELTYNEARGYYQYCNGLEWVLVGNKPGPTNCPDVGDQCDDDSYYIGEMNGHRLYMADSTSDTTRTWNDGSGNYSDLNIDDAEDGLANTIALVQLDTADDPYEAAEYCYNLVSLGHADWYLPAADEIALIENGGSPLGDIGSPASGYWTSTENSDELAVRWFMPGGISYNGKYQTRNVRCIRRN